MSLILKALEKAKSIAGRKPAPPPHPAALASFRFGRPARARRMRKVVTVAVLPIIVAGAGTGYGIRYWLKKPARRAAVVVNTPPKLDTPAPVPETQPPLPPPPAPEPPTAAPHHNAAPPPVQSASAVSDDAAAPPKPAPRPRRAVIKPAQNDVTKAPDAAPTSIDATTKEAPPEAAAPAPASAV